MSNRPQRARAACARLIIAAALAASPAYADAIDGAWCRGAQTFTIAGPTITTPAGTQLVGDYSRHGYRYVVPAAEPEAGTQIDMTLVQEDRVDLVRRRQDAVAPTETWLRCRPIS